MLLLLLQDDCRRPVVDLGSNRVFPRILKAYCRGAFEDLGSNRLLLGVICNWVPWKLLPFWLHRDTAWPHSRGFVSLLRQSLSACSTPANWPYNHESIGKKGWAFLLPTVTPDVSCLAGVSVISRSICGAGSTKPFQAARMFECETRVETRVRASFPQLPELIAVVCALQDAKKHFPGFHTCEASVLFTP